jgi:NAD(P)-dependent dehydrogenase (short-subunit alcohol dehydrogenase family)
MGKRDQSEVVVVTGASAGLGRAIACSFARRGASVGLLARGAEGLEGARRDVEKLGGRALALPTDVAAPQQVEAAAERVERAFGPVDVWVNNAMTTVLAPSWETEPEDFRRVTEVTYLGYVYGTLAALKRMRPRDRGMIVQVGSALAERSVPLQSAYCGAKHAIRGFTDSVRCELIHEKSNVRLTMVQMPALNTPQFSWARSAMPRKAKPIAPVYQPEVAAEMVYWAAHRRRREVLVGFSTVKAMWANRFVPKLLDYYLGKKGVDGQLRDEAEDPGRPDNLWSPVPGDFGAHGEFDEEARSRCWQTSISKHRNCLAIAGLAGVALTLGAAALCNGRDRR